MESQGLTAIDRENLGLLLLYFGPRAPRLNIALAYARYDRDFHNAFDSLKRSMEYENPLEEIMSKGKGNVKPQFSAGVRVKAEPMRSLFKKLGEAFSLDKSVIRHVVGKDDDDAALGMTVDKLLHMSGLTLEFEDIFTNVFVKNLSQSTTEEDLQKVFAEYGTITSAAVMRDVGGQSKRFGFINFENSEDAAKAVDALNGYKFDNKVWFVGRAQNKFEREQELKNRFEQKAKNLDDIISDEKLRELFTPCGAVTSCKVIRDPRAFPTSKKASEAYKEMTEKIIASKRLYVGASLPARAPPTEQRTPMNLKFEAREPRPHQSSSQHGPSSGSLTHDLGRSSEQLEYDGEKQKLEMENLEKLFTLTVRLEEELKSFQVSSIVRLSDWNTVTTKPSKDKMVEYRSVTPKKKVLDEDEYLRKETQKWEVQGSACVIQTDVRGRSGI